MKKSICKPVFILTAAILCSICLFAQDKFSVTQLTFDPAQEGFPTWSPDGKFIVYSHIAMNDSLGMTGLWRISSDGKGAKRIYDRLAEHPKWSPDGRFIVFDADSGKSIKMIPAQGGALMSFLPDSIRIVNGGMPCWSPDGTRIGFLEGGTLSLCVFDMKTRKTARIFRHDGMVPIPGCWTKDGKSILVPLMERQTRKSSLWKISSNGKTRKQIFGHHEGIYRHLALSPDGSLLVYGAREGNQMNLWIMPAGGGKSIPLAISHPGHNEGQSWSPDGKRLAFNSTRSGNFEVWVMDVNVDQIKKELREPHP